MSFKPSDEVIKDLIKDLIEEEIKTGNKSVRFYWRKHRRVMTSNKFPMTMKKGAKYMVVTIAAYTTFAVVETYLPGINSDNVTSDILGS